MGLFSSFLNPTDGTQGGYKKLKKDYKRSIADFNQTRSLTDPYFTDLLEGGRSAYDSLAAMSGIYGSGAQGDAISNWQMSPAFQAALDRGQRSIDQGAAARGMLMSGDALNASREYGQDMQNQEYDNQLARLGNLVNYGQAGAGGLTSNANTLANLRIGKGQASLGLGQAKDAGNQAALGNVLGLAGTLVGMGTGLPVGSFGGFGQNGRFTGSYNQFQQPQMPTYYGTNQINPYGLH